MCNLIYPAQQIHCKINTNIYFAKQTYFMSVWEERGKDKTMFTNQICVCTVYYVSSVILLYNMCIGQGKTQTSF